MTAQLATQATPQPAPIESRPMFNVIRHALDVFGSANKTVTWLTTANASLNGQRPWDLLDTPAHIERVFVALTRIEHGVFS